jgi:membrane fusion protein, multidrug efflux system
MDTSVQNAPSPAAQLMRQRRRTWFMILGGALAILAIAVALWWWLYASRYQSTDDAYVAGDLVGVMSQVSGTVIAIGADETDRVQAGEVLVRLDPTDTRIALQAAEQQLARTVRQVHTVFANRAQGTALVAERRADLDRALADFDRRKNLTATGAVSTEELGHARDSVNAARDALSAAEKNLAASAALVGRTGVADNPDVQAAATTVENAWLNLQRTSVRAPVSGYVARRAVQLGERISPGTALLAIVPLERVWIEANFKEVQLNNMRIGQPVRVVSDLYGRNVPFQGRVAGLGMGTGSAFALLPAQNATGNWIKVVQRVPVRITLDPEELRQHPLRIGLSTTVTVDVRDTSGPQLAAAPNPRPVLATDAFEIDRSEIKERIAQIVEENRAAPAPASAAPARAEARE